MSALLGAAKGLAGLKAVARKGIRRGLARARMRPAGLRRRRRGRGISAAGIRAARRLMNLLRDFATAVPHRRGFAPRRRRRFFRRGDPEDEEEFE